MNLSEQNGTGSVRIPWCAHDNSCEFWKSFGIWKRVNGYVCFFLLTIGLLGNVMSTAAFLKLAKKATPYVHQILISFLAISADAVFNIWANRAPSFIQNTPLLYLLFAVYPIANMFTIANAIQLNCVTMDRLHALYRPLLYRGVQQKKRMRQIAALSFTLGFLSSFHDCFRMYIQWQPHSGRYLLKMNMDFVTGPVSKVFSILRIILRVLLIMGMIAQSFLLIRKFRKENRERAVKCKNSQKESGLISEKAMTILVVSQVFLCITGQVNLVAYYGALYILNITSGKVEGVLSQLTLITSTIFISLNFVIYFAMSGEFRRAVWGILGCKKWADKKTTSKVGASSIKNSAKFNQNIQTF